MIRSPITRERGISLPKGAYVPVFEESTAASSPAPVRPRRRFLWLAPVPVLLAVAALPRLEGAAREGPIRAVEASRNYAMLNQPQQALDWLETAFQRRERQVLWLQVDPRFRSLQSEPRLRALVGKMGLSTSP